ncbi:alpha-(1,3)-fucosyltransferase B-like [Pectinophora gossypiella]|uniref:alpha-(1,3)-fucosyltransferase B-like n=1 Tax=Pectinophora gossypiella TaxID=13191 RepID=UPI00214DFB2F|nr:alpha-(1,3)-fucosyltransferase B-like [Pectinophora gossypiella]
MCRLEAVQPSETRRWPRDPFNSLQVTPKSKTLKIYSKFLLKVIAGVTLLSFMIFLVNIRLDSGNQLDISPKNKSIDYDNYANIRNPALVWYTSEVWWIPFNRKLVCSKNSKSVECEVFRQESEPDEVDAYLFYSGYIGRFPLPRRPETIWALVHDETPLNRLPFMYEAGLNLFNFSATFSRFSDVPMPLIWSTGLYDITSPTFFLKTSVKNSLLGGIAPVIFMQSNCDTSTERDAYVRELGKHIRIDSYGMCLRNKELLLPKMYQYDESVVYMTHLYGEEILKFLAKYKFIIAIENAVCNDYLTEKFWRSITVGTVPIYFGSPLIRDWLPNNKSAILLEDFPTPELLSQHLHYLLNNDTAYEEYLEHKTLGIITNQKLIDKLFETPTELSDVVQRLECLVCEKLHTKSKAVNMVTKKHYDCPLPVSALSLSVNPKNKWLKLIDEAKEKVDGLYEEIRQLNRTRRKSKITWGW